MAAEGLNLRKFLCRCAEGLAGVDCLRDGYRQTFGFQRGERRLENGFGTTRRGAAFRPCAGQALASGLTPTSPSIGRIAFWEKLGSRLRLRMRWLDCPAGLLLTVEVGRCT